MSESRGYTVPNLKIGLMYSNYFFTLNTKFCAAQVDPYHNGKLRVEITPNTSDTSWKMFLSINSIFLTYEAHKYIFVRYGGRLTIICPKHYCKFTRVCLYNQHFPSY